MPHLFRDVETQPCRAGNTLACSTGSLCKCRADPALQGGIFGQSKGREEEGEGEEKKLAIVEEDFFFKGRDSFISSGRTEKLWLTLESKLNRPNRSIDCSVGSQAAGRLWRWQTTLWVHSNVSQTKNREHAVLEHTAKEQVLSAASPCPLLLNCIPAATSDLLSLSF